MVRGKKICAKCLNAQVKTANENDHESAQLLQDLCKLFSLPRPKDSFLVSIESLTKNGMTVQGIRITLQYCVRQGLFVREENWSFLIRLYYKDAQKEEERRKNLNKQNDKVVISNQVEIYKFKGTTYRDLPPVNIDDL